VRERGLHELLQLQKQGFRIDIQEGDCSPAEYLGRCARSWLVWSPEGYGWDCFRQYEAAYAGSVPVISRQTIERHMPLREGDHCYYYDVEEGHLARVIRQALLAPDVLLAMAAAGREHVLKHHTPQALAQYVVQATLGSRPLNGGDTSRC
jgi:hypothetical protein